MPTVYFLTNLDPQKIKSVLPKFTSPLGVKVHFGEEGNTTFVPAEKIKQLVDLLPSPTLIECNVLYKSPRAKTSTHLGLARRHGFDFASLDILDGEAGDEDLELPVRHSQHFQTAYFGAGLQKYPAIFFISHFKGHISAGFGGALKNIGMGLASRRGKLALHASVKHQVKPEKCIGCGSCIANCPVGAISYDDSGKARIDQSVCISCSKCMALCPSGAINVPWGGTTKETFQERLAEYALAAVAGRQCFYLNFLMNITEKCDCHDQPMPILTPDIGILLSSDPVAIDQASYDLVTKQYPEFAEFGGLEQLSHGEEIGLGSRQYNLINVS
ncbi:MAG TPA: DUF362 domain-containing protein [bacterium]|nr:DUF362 domain-containing protein [bacterium]